MAPGLLTPAQFGAKLSPPISGRRVIALINAKKVPEAEKVGKGWVIPEKAKDPRDQRWMKKAAKK